MKNEMKLTHGSLFSGIGGFDLAAQWAGINTLFHCEKDSFCQTVLNYHFPNATLYEDITKTDFTKWRGKIDVLSGGFPCQPFSVAGQRGGAEDDRYLWPEMLRAIKEIKPAWVIGENVAGILSMVQPGQTVEVGREGDLFGESYDIEEVRKQYVIDTICGDLEREGYTIQAFVIPACAVGAPHRRDRIWIVARCANARVESLRESQIHKHQSGTSADAPIARLQRRIHCRKQTQTGIGNDVRLDTTRLREQGTSADTKGVGRCSRRPAGAGIKNNKAKRSNIYERIDGFGSKQTTSHAYSGRWMQNYQNIKSGEFEQNIPNWGEFPTQSPVCSRNDGISGKLDGITFPKWRSESIKGYGNAIVPQIAYELFKAIKDYERIYQSSKGNAHPSTGVFPHSKSE